MASRTPGRVVFIRHGESIWNVNDAKRGLVSRFTGWADIPLTDHGRRQASAAGRCLKRFQITPDAIYTSLLRRSKETAQEIKLAAGGRYDTVPVINSWRLNERHYGALVGLPKDLVGSVLDHEEVMGWRRSWDKAPPPMSAVDKRDWRDALWAKPITVINNPLEGKTVTMTEKNAVIPTTESLQDCALRVKPAWVNGIAPRVARGETVLVVAHANSIRSMIKCIDASTLNEESIRGVHIPSATPLVYTFTTVDPARYQVAGAQAVQEEGRGRSGASIMPVGVPSRLGMTGRYVATREIVQLNLGVVPADEDQKAAALGGSSMFDLIDKSLPQLLAYAEMDRTVSRNRAVVVTDGRGVILHVNAPWQELTGFSAEYCRGRTCKFLQGPLTSSDEVDALNEKLRTGLPAKATLLNYRKDGTAFEAVLTVIPVFDWLNDPAYRPLGFDRQAASSNARQQAARALDYGGEFSQFSVVEKDRIVMNPSHFVAKLELVPPPPPQPRYTPTRYVDEDGVEYTEEWDQDPAEMSYPPLTPEQMRARDAGEGAYSSGGSPGGGYSNGGGSAS